MINTVITILILSALVLLFCTAQLWKKANRLKKEIQEGELIAQMRDLVDEMKDSGVLVETKPTETTQNESPASETVKRVDWEPDDYKDLSAAKYERFGDSEIEEAREYLTTKQRKSIGG